MTRTVGVVLIVAAAAIGLIGSVLLIAQLAQGDLMIGGAILGFGLLAVVLVGPLAAAGIFTILRGRKEAEETSEADMQRKILDMVKTRGKVNVSDVIIELQSDLPTVQNMIYELVGMGVFSGYVNWDEGTLYSAEASELQDLQQCRNCGAELSLAGKGIAKCPYCGTEYFIA